MENREKKKLTKGEIAMAVLVSVLIVVYISIIILILFNIIPNLRWAAHICACIIWLIIGCMTWAKTRWQSILNFVVSAAHAVLFVLELVHL